MKETVLFETHKNLGANFGEFGGYKMPLWYNSAKEEHLNVLTNIGLFDTSHMAVFSVKGSNSLELINSAFSRDITDLKIGKSVYGLFLTEEGHVIDDSIVYYIGVNDYLFVVNAGMAEIVINFIKSFNFKNYQIINFTDKLGKIDVQGPKSLKLMERIFGDTMFDSFPYFSFKGHFIKGGTLISRSGYTGEFGFEIYVEKDKATQLWEKLLSLGEDLGIKPCGFAARDSLRVGACLPLSHQDIGNWEFCNTPWDFVLSRNINSVSSYTYPYVGFDVRKLHDSKGDVLLENNKIGEVLSCITEVSIIRVNDEILSIKTKKIDKNIKIKGLVAGFIKVNRKLSYNDIVVITDGKRNLEVEIVKDIRPDRTARLSIEKLRSF